jgi:hypothetical protein
MPIEIEEKIQGRSIVVHISGMLSKADYPDFVSEFDRLVRLSGKQRVLFDLTGLEGWDLGAAWADKKWEQFMSFLLKPFTGAKTRYFDHADAAQARKWLEEGPTAPAPTAANV